MLYQQMHFNQIKSKMAAYTISNVRLSPTYVRLSSLMSAYVRLSSTLLLLQQGNLYQLQQKIMHGISRSSSPEVICKKAALKTTQNSQGNTCVEVSL